MPPRPFPLPFRVGTDIICQSRIRDVITKEAPKRSSGTQLDAFLRRVFTQREISHFWKRFEGFHVEKTTRLPSVTAHLAGRWAAKEAAVKAVKPRKLTWMDVEILQQPDTKELYALIRDKPFVHQPLPGTKKLHLTSGLEQPTASESSSPQHEPAVSPEAEQEDQNDPSGQIAIISISHDKDYATAVCVAAEEPVPGDVGGEAAARLYFDA
ncbi:Putative holo-[acyl carrier protein] synthase [Septoria linicola]|uniref:Holo-[acyl carrier protein] synthase n=1 Tax=Septoria linicola TaxID=215465 RepID=A0A9Q9ASY9_9PEZI|nr:putative holo-[acyl carrier protein] synthase [Septoria linicola]USW54560.1 Putative holo-[acyl carrier protein] synthase [Septoria linicola]